MNIDIIQAANQPQRSSVRDPAPPPARTTNTGASQNSSPANTRAIKDQHDANSTQGQPSVSEAVKRLSEFVAAARPEISFSVDEASGVQVVKIMDSQTKDVIRQFPSEEAIQIAKALDKLQGLFVKDKA